MPEFDHITPVVLVGGRSTRFGRDKLVEPLEDGMLVDRPIDTLRSVFGPRVAVIGDAQARVIERADRVIEDRWPGRGPAGGILSGLQATHGPLFVLAGDLARIAPAHVLEVLGHAERFPAAAAVLAHTTHPEPCIALYRPSAEPFLLDAIDAGMPIGRTIPPAQSVHCHLRDPRGALNVNRSEDLSDDPT